jgi:peroxiredoxin
MMIGWVAAMAFLGSMSVGEVAPDFTVKDTDGTSWTLSKMVEHGPVVVAFFPKAFTGG